MVAAALVAVTACSPGQPPAGDAGDAPEPFDRGPDTIALPQVAGAGSIADGTPAEFSPTVEPDQAGGELEGRALPTNQWWSSALVGPFTEPLWARPLAVRAGEDGFAVSGAAPVAAENSVVTAFVPAVTAGGDIDDVQITDYGPLHVTLSMALADGGSLESVVVQGSPVAHLQFEGTTPRLALGEGAVVAESPDPAEGTARVTIGGQSFDVVAVDGAWSQEDGDLVADGGDGLVAVARVPEGAEDGQWSAALAEAAGDPATGSAATMAYDGPAGTVTQVLAVQRESGGAGLWALLPHQQAALVRGDGEQAVEDLAGSYADSRGTLALVSAQAVRLDIPLPGLLPGVPEVPLDDAAAAAVAEGLKADLADESAGGGSYFGFKELSRLATIAEVAQATGATEERQEALAELRTQLEDWLTYGGPDDGRYFGYDSTWGGLIAVPAEFGSNDYNDHHFQFAYLVRAAAVLATAEPDFAEQYGPLVDLVVRDYAGAAEGQDVAGFPPFRAFNPYLGHSYASGYAKFADGNNQESSSEAVHAWEAVARWGLATGQDPLVQLGVTRYAVEAQAARTYWLGEAQDIRPEGYEHTIAGIVWDSKIDFGTWFDARPEAVYGIQLLPITFGSLYRYDGEAAAQRAEELGDAVGGQPRLWGNLFAADLAVADPAAARKALEAGVKEREPSTSRAMVRYWVEVLAELGPPQPAVFADGPYGLAFGSPEDPRLVAVNPSAEPVSVTFRRDGDEVAELDVPPGESATR